MIFTGHNPYHPHAAPPTPANDVPLAMFRAAVDVHATHLSADGLRAYDQRQYGVWWCGWDEETKQFGSWYKIPGGELPAGVVRMP